jgi:hypothetical protein
MKNIEIGIQHLTNFKEPESQVKLSVPESSITINNVFGINKDGILPARFLSGFIPTFTLAGDIQNSSNCKPHVRIFRPTNISRFVNNIPQGILEKQIAAGNLELRRFASRFFPQVNFSIEEDEPVSEEALKVLARIGELIQTQGAIDLQDGLKDSGRKMGGQDGESNSFLYAANHLFGWEDMHHVAFFQQIPGDTVINTTPPSEKKFKKIRDLVLGFTQEDIKEMKIGGVHKDLVISMCGTPHYIFLKGSDGNAIEPSFDEVLSIVCAEILDDMQARFKNEKDSKLKDNLRRIRTDFKKLLLTLSANNEGILREITFESLIKGEL